MTNVSNILIKYSIIFTLLGSIFSCQGTKGLQEGERLYTGAEIQMEDEHIEKKDKKELKEELKSNLTPKPNTKFLGMRPKLAIYNMVGEVKKDKGIKHWIKTKLGEPPVLMEDVNKSFNVDIIENHAQNKGYFNTDASFETIEKEKTGSMIYYVDPDYRYHIEDVTYVEDTTQITQQIIALKDKSFLKKGDPFDLEVIKGERERIDAQLKQKGYYFFSPENIIVLADSTVTENHTVDLEVKLKEDAPAQALEAYTIDKTIVFADYDLDQAKKHNFKVPIVADELVKVKDRLIIDPENKFKPNIFDRALFFHQGELYNRADHNTTLNRLISLGVFKFVKNQFVISDSVNNTFDAYYLLTPKKFKSIRLETLAKSNSENFVGGEVNLNWSHRNLFRGAELFKASIFTSLDYQLGGPENSNNLLRYGASASLAVPRLWVPFWKVNPRGNYLPKTLIDVSYEFQKRTNLYTLGSANASFGYTWKENARKEHHLKLLDFTYVHASNITEEYQEQIEGNPNLERVVEDQLIFGPSYTYTYTNTMLNKPNTIYYQGNIDLSGNVTGLITGADAKNGDQVRIFDIPFSQYAKIDNDFRFYHNFSKKHMVAARLLAGVAYPYGNSEEIPFSKQFFVGGSSSLRGFKARTVGPGSYLVPEDQNVLFYDQVGDIRLETNLEYRFNIYKFLNGAVFADAGNVWLINENENRPGGKFGGDFLKEIAMDVGFGLRFDFSILVLRLDLATPIRVPYRPEGERWNFDDIDIGDSDWRNDNLVLNIAIGYPF